VDTLAAEFPAQTPGPWVYLEVIEVYWASFIEMLDWRLLTGKIGSS